jgi:hypothetical protein
MAEDFNDPHHSDYSSPHIPVFFVFVDVIRSKDMSSNFKVLGEGKTQASSRNARAVILVGSIRLKAV